MAYRLKKGRLDTKAVRRLCREQISRALATLEGEAVTAEGVHECRKVVKRLRAVLRLIEPEISHKAYRRSYRGIGKVGDLLAGSRERHVQDVTIAKLEARFEAEGAAALAPLKTHFEEVRLAHPRTVDPAVIGRLKRRLEDESARIEKMRLHKHGFGAVARGLTETYGLAKACFARVRRKPTDARLHELRKAVQWHWRQLSLIASAWPEQFAVRINACRELAEILGDDHDLAVLLDEVADIAGLQEAEAVPIEMLILKRQDELRSKVPQLGQRLFAERPDAFERRMRAYWGSAKTVSPPSAADPVAASLAQAAATAARHAAAAPRLVVKAPA